MPYRIRRRDGRFCVYKLGPDGEPTGEALGCHATEADAQMQITALYANEKAVDTVAFGGILKALDREGSGRGASVASPVGFALEIFE